MSSTRLTRPEAEALMLNLAMNRLAKDTDFRTQFIHTLNVLKSVVKVVGNYEPGVSAVALRRWSAVCLVASAIHARSSEAWEEFKEEHFRKIETRWEVGILIDLWAKHTDIEKALEVFSEMSEEGKIDEGEYVRQMDLAKFAYQLQEEWNSKPKLCVRVGPNPDAWMEG
jgi:pentatricopeptide repeat protein